MEKVGEKGEGGGGMRRSTMLMPGNKNGQKKPSDQQNK